MVLKACEVINDQQSSHIRMRIEGVICDLPAAGASYHYTYNVKFIVRKLKQFQRNNNTTVPDSKQIAFNSIVTLMEEDKTKMWRSVSLFSIYVSNGGI